MLDGSFASQFLKPSDIKNWSLKSSYFLEPIGSFFYGCCVVRCRSSNFLVSRLKNQTPTVYPLQHSLGAAVAFALFRLIASLRDLTSTVVIASISHLLSGSAMQSRSPSVAIGIVFAIWVASLRCFVLAQDEEDHSYTTSHSSHEHHDAHESHESEGLWKHAAVFDLEAGTSHLIAVSAAGFDGDSFAFMVVPTASADEEGLEAAEASTKAGKTLSRSDLRLRV